jgi:hypothetical protein
VASITSRWKKFISVGCSHGIFADPDAIAAVLKFAEQYKPETRIHHGDVCDYAAFRSGAPGSKDEAKALGPDLTAGIDFLNKFRPTHVILGNHDDRVFRDANHHNAIVALAAAHCRDEFRAAINKLQAKLIDVYDINAPQLQLGDTKLIHGFGMGGENALRDHAEHFGKCICAHFHRAESAGGRRDDHPICYCVGTLATIGMMEYAKTRRATARWSHGFAWGEYNDTYCHINLASCPQGQAKNWRLPL